MHRWSILIIAQRGATQNSLFIILRVHSTCFGCQPHPSSGVHKTVTTASGTGHIFFFFAATSFQLGQATPVLLMMGVVDTRNMWPRWREVAAQKIWPVPEALVTVLCTHDDGCDWHPKHVEWTRIIINRLFCVSSHWTIINIMTGLFSSCHSKYLTLIFQPVKWNVSDLHFPVKINWNFGQDFVTVFWRFCGSERGNQTVCKLSRAN